MRYLITIKDQEPFNTDWFDSENHFMDNMIVYDLVFYTYTDDGVNWFNIKMDTL